MAREIGLDPARPVAALLVHTVDNGRREPQRHAARAAGHWYFVHSAGLARVAEAALARPGASLDQGEELPVPPGQVRGVLAFRDRLLLAVSEPGGGDCRLWTCAPPEHRWREAGRIPGRLGNWCREPQGRYAFAVVDPGDKSRPEPRAILLSEDGEDWRPFELLERAEAGHVHSLCMVGERLLVLVGDEHFRHLAITVADASGSLLRDAALRRREPLGLSHRSLFRVLPRPGGGLAYALDGATELYAADGSFWRSDYADGRSGCQVAAHLHHPALPELLFLGTWRRNAAHPYPCLHILTPGGMAKFVEDSRPFEPELAWCGFQMMDASIGLSGPETHAVQFWPCCGGRSLCFVPLDGEGARARRAAGVPLLDRAALDALPGGSLKTSAPLPAPPFLVACGEPGPPWRP